MASAWQGARPCAFPLPRTRAGPAAAFDRPLDSAVGFVSEWILGLLTGRRATAGLRAVQRLASRCVNTCQRESEGPVGTRSSRALAVMRARGITATLSDESSPRYFEERGRMTNLDSDRGSGSADAPDHGHARDEQSFLLQRVQPAMAGLMDGSLSTLAPIFAVALATHQPRYAFFAGLATAIGAGVSMAFSEGLSDTGDVTGRGSPYLRGSIIGAGTFLGGILHTLPFLIPQFRAALIVAIIVVTFELLALAWIRWRFFNTGFLRSFLSITLGGAIIAAISAALGGAAG